MTIKTAKTKETKTPPSLKRKKPTLTQQLALLQEQYDTLAKSHAKLESQHATLSEAHRQSRLREDELHHKLNDLEHLPSANTKLIEEKATLTRENKALRLSQDAYEAKITEWYERCLRAERWNDQLDRRLRKLQERLAQARYIVETMAQFRQKPIASLLYSWRARRKIKYVYVTDTDKVLATVEDTGQENANLPGNIAKEEVAA